MTDEEILALLKKMIEENDDFEEKDITFFEIIDKSDKETLISRMLAYTLKKDEGLAGKLIKYASKGYLNAGNNSFEDIVVTNIRCGKVLPGGSRIDIFVEAQDSFGQNYTLTIENKIESHEHSNQDGDQTQRYFGYIDGNYKKSTNLYFYLKPENNCGDCSCKEFVTITYKELESLIEDKGDSKIADFKNHIQKHFVEVNMENTDIEILRNYRDIKRVYEKAQKAYRNKQNNLNSAILSLIKEGFGNGWETQESEGRYRFYRNEWWHDCKDEPSKKYYFYVGLVYEDNCPDRIYVQGCVKKYSTATDSIVKKFINNDSLNIKYEVIDNGDVFEFYKEPFDPQNYAIYSREWENKLKEFAMEHIRKAIIKIDEVFTSFKSYEERVDK